MISLLSVDQFARERSDVLTTVNRCVRVEERPSFGRCLLNVHIHCLPSLHDLVSRHQYSSKLIAVEADTCLVDAVTRTRAMRVALDDGAFVL